jgi:hypothetical protein
MKIVTITAAALLAGLTFANAQNAPTTTNPAPSSINKGALPSTPSGSQSQQAGASRAPAKIVGKSKFCSQSSSGMLNCRFASMSACQKKEANSNLRCFANPSMGTVGKKP